MLRKSHNPLGVSHGWAQVEVKTEVPPAVLAARLKLGWSLEEAKKISGKTLPNDMCKERPAVRQEEKLTPCLQPLKMVTKAGEVLTKKREMAPWEPQGEAKKPCRGDAGMALTIAASESQRKLAKAQFDSLKFAPSSANVKSSLFTLWEKICKELHVPPLPLSVTLMDNVAAILRASGYKAITAYVQEAKSRHIREGFDWSDRLQQGMADIKRASKRASGPALRAEELKMEWWAKVIINHGKEPKEIVKDGKEPAGGARVWLIAIHFLLRETELAGLTADENCIKLDSKNMTVGLHLTVQKTDPSARGTWRALACSCSKAYPHVCPYHNALELVELQLKRCKLRSQAEAAGRSLPLVGQQEDPWAFVEKDKMINNAQKFAGLMINHLEEAKDVKIERVTGHFARRTGVKNLARKGISYSAIQWLARHSSNVTMQYIESAWEEMPRAELRMQDTMSMNEIVTSVLSRVGEVEETIKQVEEQMTEQMTSLCPTEWMPDSRENLRKEIRSAMIPKWILSLQSKKLHKACRASCTGQNPRFWTTECGWRWFDSVNHCQLVYEEEERESFADVTECQKCFGS